MFSSNHELWDSPWENLDYGVEDETKNPKIVVGDELIELIRSVAREVSNNGYSPSKYRIIKGLLEKGFALAG